MDDLISRSWLLDVVENIISWDTERDRNRAIHQVRELTPAAVVRCKDCKYYSRNQLISPCFDGCVGFGKWFGEEETSPMDFSVWEKGRAMADLISRQAALDAIEQAAQDNLADANHHYLMGFQDAAEAVEQVPAAARERKAGNPGRYCTNCGAKTNHGT